MENFLALYAEAGMIGVVGAMFVFMVYQNAKRSEQQAGSIQDLQVINKGQEETLENMEGMLIKLIERWNKSDDVSLRHRQDMIEALSDVEKQLSRIDGIMSRMNGNGK